MKVVEQIEKSETYDRVRETMRTQLSQLISGKLLPEVEKADVQVFDLQIQLWGNQDLPHDQNVAGHEKSQSDELPSPSCQDGGISIKNSDKTGNQEVKREDIKPCNDAEKTDTDFPKSNDSIAEAVLIQPAEADHLKMSSGVAENNEQILSTHLQTKPDETVQHDLKEALDVLRIQLDGEIKEKKRLEKEAEVFRKKLKEAEEKEKKANELSDKLAKVTKLKDQMAAAAQSLREENNTLKEHHASEEEKVQNLEKEVHEKDVTIKQQKSKIAEQELTAQTHHEIAVCFMEELDEEEMNH